MAHANGNVVDWYKGKARTEPVLGEAPDHPRPALLKPTGKLAGLGRRIFLVREQLGVTQAEMARMLGVSYTTVNRIERMKSLKDSMSGQALDHLHALEVALKSWNSSMVRAAAGHPRPRFLLKLYTLAYGDTKSRGITVHRPMLPAKKKRSRAPRVPF